MGRGLRQKLSAASVHLSKPEPPYNSRVRMRDNPNGDEPNWFEIIVEDTPSYATFYIYRHEPHQYWRIHTERVFKVKDKFDKTLNKFKVIKEYCEHSIEKEGQCGFQPYYKVQVDEGDNEIKISLLRLHTGNALNTAETINLAAKIGNIEEKTVDEKTFSLDQLAQSLEYALDLKDKASTLNSKSEPAAAQKSPSEDVLSTVETIREALKKTD
jgi:hypothetical protein